MIKTRIVEICDYCEKDLFPNDIVFGYLVGKNSISTLASGSDEVYIHPECFEKMVETFIQDIKNSILGNYEKDKFYIRVNKIHETFIIKRLKQTDFSNSYFYITINNNDYLIIYDIQDGEFYGLSHIEQTFKNLFVNAKLVDVRNILKNIKASMLSTSSYDAATKATSTIYNGDYPKITLEG